MKNTNKTGDKIFLLVDFMEHLQNDTANSLEETVKEGTVIEEKRSEIFIDSENQMSVVAPDKFGGHFRGTVKAIFITAGRAKFSMTAEGNEFKFTAMRASVHGTAIGRIPTINHLRNVFHDNRTRMESIFNFLIMIFKNLL